MARRVSWTNNSSGHNGTYVYRAPTLDPQNLPAPVATVDPVAQGATAEWVDSEELAAGDYDYAVQDFDGQGVGALSALAAYSAPADLSTAQIGDEIGGGIYAGTHTNGTETWHLIFAKQDGEAGAGLEWGNYSTLTGADDPDDGLANQNLILAGFDNGDSQAFYYCRDYVDSEGNNDYYLAARNEMAKVDQLVAMSHPDFVTDTQLSRWTSSEYTDGQPAFYVWRFNFSTGESDILKNNTNLLTRPARRVPA